MPDPQVSVILPAWQSHATIGACLESLRRQTLRDFEVIVVDSSPGPETRQIVAGRFPEVRLEYSAERLSAHAARNRGATLARGEILVFSDPDCRMEPEWLERLISAHREGRLVVGGSVDALGDGWFESGVHWVKYPWWLSAGPRGRRPELPTANVSYARELFRRIGPFPEAWYGDTVLSRRAANLGFELWFEPGARVAHDHNPGWRSFLAERFDRGREFGLARPRLERWSRLRTLTYLLAAPALVLWMAARSLRYVRSLRQFTQWLWRLPVILAGFAARQLGEAWGHWRTLWRCC